MAPEALSVRSWTGLEAPLGEKSVVAVEAALAAFRAGRMVIVVDDEDRENEGDLTIAAQFSTAASINLMARLARGLICISMEGEQLDRLGIPQMVAANSSHFDTPFAVSVDARNGVTSGVSAADRARTVQTLINPATGPSDIAMPGHLFPLRARRGGVLERRGQTEAVVDLCRLAGLYPAALLTEVMALDGTMARLPLLQRLSRRLGIPIVSVEQIRVYRLKHERLVQRGAETVIPSVAGEWRAVAYTSSLDDDEHVAFVLGRLQAAAPINVAVHSQDVIAEVLGGSLRAALRRIERIGRGVVLYRIPRGPALDTAAESLGPVQRQILADLGVSDYRQLQMTDGFEDDTLSPTHYARMEADDWC
ncbi:MAG: 3,4-dihydroxy-2-butanone-4-phosphate synthase [Dehalococcoidia bacterium]